MPSLAATKTTDKPTTLGSNRYPVVHLYGNQVKAFLEGHRIQMGKVYEATVQFKIEGWSEREGSKSLELCLLTSDGIEEVGEYKESKKDSKKESKEEPKEDEAYS